MRLKKPLRTHRLGDPPLIERRFSRQTRLAMLPLPMPAFRTVLHAALAAIVALLAGPPCHGGQTEPVPGTASPADALPHEQVRSFIEVDARTPGDQPIPGLVFTATFVSPWQDGRSAGKTAEDGTLRLEVPPGRSIDWFAAAPNAGNTAQGSLDPLSPGETVQVVARVHAFDDTTLRARFIDRATGVAIGGVRLQRFTAREGVSTTETFEPPVETRVVSDEAGRIEVSAATWREYHFVAAAPGYAHGYLVIGAGECQGEGLTIPLRRECSLEMNVIGVEPGMWIRASLALDRPLAPEDDRNHFAMGGCKLRASRVGSSNQFTLGGLPPRAHVDLHAMMGRSVLHPLESIRTGEAGSRTSLDLDLRRQCEVLGRVCGPAGLPLPGQPIELRKATLTYLPTFTDPRGLTGSVSTVTDSLGAYSFDDLIEGTYLVSIPVAKNGPLGGPEIPSSWIVDPIIARLTPAEPRMASDLQYEVGGYIAGTLLGPDGAPTAGLVAGLDRERRHKVNANHNGRFRVGPFRRGMTARVMASAPGGLYRHHSGRLKIAVPTEDAELRVRGKGDIHGRLLCAPAGADLSGTTLCLDGKTVLRGRVDPNGRFMLKRILAGKHTLSAHVGASRTSPPVGFEVRPGEVTRGLELALPPR